MKNLVFAFALLCSTSLVAQFGYNANGTGIQSTTNTASGTYSIAMGSAAQSSGGYSTVIGTQSFATAIGSIAIGGGVHSDGFYSVGLGSSILASGDYSLAMGRETTASGDWSTAMGKFTEASGWYSTAMGDSTTASGSSSTAMGADTTASGSYSTAMGWGTNALDLGTTAIGLVNYDGTPNPNYISPQNTAFVIGNGTFQNGSNAFEVLFDGTTTIAGDLNINSDARLKANIISLGATLSKLLQIDGKTYTMKKDANHKKKIGLIAQDIEKVFPELVTETNDIKSVNYQGLVPVLINAMKEQQEEIDELKALVKQLLEK